MRDEELEKFKREVNLAELAASYGYAVVSRESSKTCLTMKHAAGGSKIVVGTGEDGHGIFFEVHGDGQGSVIDFVKYQEGCNLGQARVKLRDYLGQPRLHFTFAKPAPMSRDRAGTVAR